MRMNPEDYCMKFLATTVPTMERSEAERLVVIKEVLSESLAKSVVQMDRFTTVGLSDRGDEQHVLELFVFTREEMNQFMESVADATVEYLSQGSGVN